MRELTEQVVHLLHDNQKLNDDLEYLFKGKAREVLRQGREIAALTATNQDLIQQKLTLQAKFT